MCVRVETLLSRWIHEVENMGREVKSSQFFEKKWNKLEHLIGIWHFYVHTMDPLGRSSLGVKFKKYFILRGTDPIFHIILNIDGYDFLKFELLFSFLSWLLLMSLRLLLVYCIFIVRTGLTLGTFTIVFVCNIYKRPSSVRQLSQHFSSS